MKKKLITVALVAAASVQAQEFIAGWDFDGVALDATSTNANWGDTSATLSWSHSPANPPITFVSEFNIDGAYNDVAANNDFTFLAGGIDANTGFDQFSDNVGGAEQGIQFVADGNVTLSFDASGYENVTLTYALDGAKTVVDLSAFDGNGAAAVVIAANGAGSAVTWDNVAVTGTAVPEPSTFAAIAGVLALAFAASRRRK